LKPLTVAKPFSSKRILPAVFCLSFFFVVTLTAFSQSQLLKTQQNNKGFIENNGQITDQHNLPNKDVKYMLSLGNGLKLQLKANSFSYETYTVENPEKGPRKKYQMPEPVKFNFHRVDLQFLNANPAPEIIAEGVAPYGYFYAKEKKVHARAFRKITYKNIYPSIDLVFESGNNTDTGAAEYYFVVRPGGKPDQIKWKYSGALHTGINDNFIRIGVAKGDLSEHIPKSYLEGNDKPAVHVSYKMLSKDVYGFHIPAYDHTKTLTIDPQPDLIWGTYYGDDLNDWSYGIAKDQAGNLFICGGTNNAQNIATAGTYQSTMLGYADATLGKFDNNGKLLWMTYFGGSDADDAAAVTIDNAGNVIMTGSTFSTDHIATAGAYQAQNGGPNWEPDAFIAKFDNNGNILWSTFYGGEDLDYGTGVVTDANNNIFVCGFTSSTAQIATPGSYQPTYGGGTLNDANDGFLAKFTPNGSISWATYYGGPSFDRCYGIAMDNTGSVFITGTANSVSNIASANAFQKTAGGNGDAFLAKFTNAGTRVWATYYGGPGQDISFAAAVDSKENIIIGGETLSTEGIGTAGSFQSSFGGNTRDAFFAKFTNEGGRVWGSYFGREGEEDIYAIATDPSNNIFITGSTYSTTGIATPNAYQTTGGGAGGYWATFIDAFDPNSKQLWGTYYGYGGPYGQGYGYGITVDASDYVYVTGGTSFTNNISTCGAQQVNWVNNFDMFLAKFGPSTQSAIPSITITSDHDSLICKGTLVTFSAVAQNVQDNYSYEWFWNGAVVPNNNTATFSSGQFSDGDSIRCVLIVTSTCKTGNYSSNTIDVHINPDLVPSVTISSPADTICTGDSLRFTATVLNGGNSPAYDWMLNGVSTGITGPAFVAKDLVSGDKISCLLTKHNMCIPDSTASSKEITVFVRAIVQPQISITSSAATICSGLAVVFTANATNAPSPSYQWEINGTAVGTNAPAFSTTTLKDGDQVQCLLTAQSSVCAANAIASNSITEMIYGTPQITITGDTIITKGNNTTLHAAITGTADAVSYSWSPDSAISDITTPDPVVDPLSNTVYLLNVVSVNGCPAEKQVSITVISNITIPNAFTPNSDGKNDAFRALYGNDISAVHFRVFNRWGQLLFEDNGSHKTWDGTFGGTAQPAGTYVWMFEYKDITGKQKLLKGCVDLIR
jgi:gliding motility-associated-like protein